MASISKDAYKGSTAVNANDLGSFDPNAFIKQFGPSVHIASPAEVRRDAQVRSKNVFGSYNMLHEILVRHEAKCSVRCVAGHGHHTSP